jgi:hypothetical protein
MDTEKTKLSKFHEHFNEQTKWEQQELKKSTQ